MPVKTHCVDFCSFGDILATGLESCFCYAGTRCSCSRCKDFEICQVWSPQEYLDSHEGLCVHCYVHRREIKVTIRAIRLIQPLSLDS